jgi:cytochrome c oxidase subunit 3
MILFITSEVIFFVSFFWCYFDFVLVVDVELGRVWPPKGVQRINPFRVPLLNTLILLSSGVLITWSHFSILNNDWFYSVITLLFTLILGVYFLCIQFQEYIDATYTFMSRGYGRIFFLATGFHGFHVLLGCALIFGRLVRLVLLNCDAFSHYNFEFSAWYWHFVDVVWLFLFIFIYWWGF